MEQLLIVSLLKRKLEGISFLKLENRVEEKKPCKNHTRGGAWTNSKSISRNRWRDLTYLNICWRTPLLFLPKKKSELESCFKKLLEILLDVDDPSVFFIFFSHISRSSIKQTCQIMDYTSAEVDQGVIFFSLYDSLHYLVTSKRNQTHRLAQLGEDFVN